MGPSVQQLLVVLIIVVLLFGAKKIPELAKGLGKGIKTFKKEMESDEISVAKNDEIEEKPNNSTKMDDTTKA